MEMLREPEFWVAVGFVLVIALLVWKGVPKMVGKMLDQRAAVIAAELAEARRLREEAAALACRLQGQGRQRRTRGRKHSRGGPRRSCPFRRKSPAPISKSRSRAAPRRHRTRSPRRKPQR